MILADKDMKLRISRGELISQGYQKENLNGVSYDLTVSAVLDTQGTEHSEYELNPGECVFIKTREELNIPTDILGRIAEKNSRMRQGLKVDGPHYQPGHQTYAFLRVQNISANIIVLQTGMKIAQILFEQLTNEPDIPYSAQANASFQNENAYKGLGNYKEEYERQTKRKIEAAKESIEDLSQKIYANVLTIMGILVAVFALLTINYQAFTQAELDFKYVIAMNLSLTLCIVVMLGMILIFINKYKSRKFIGIYLIILAVLAALTVLMSLKFYNI